jgi:competence ComEA-like helix-hairpin-helix protein
MNRRRPSRTALVLAVFLCPALVVVINTACVKLPRRAQSADISTRTANATQGVPQPARDCATTNAPPCAAAPRININRASPEELAKLPGIGDGLAARIVAHRARYGAFRRAEHLMMVRGISERRFARLRDLVTVE